MKGKSAKKDAKRKRLQKATTTPMSVSLILDDEQSNNDANELCSFEYFDTLQCADVIIFGHLITAGCVSRKELSKVKCSNILFALHELQQSISDGACLLEA